MEKNIYDLIQDWHELLNRGIITKKEFNDKKHELLNNKKILEQDNISNNIRKEKSHNNPLKHKSNNRKSTNQNLILGLLGIAFISLITIYYFKVNSPNHEKDQYYISLVEEYLINEWEVLKEEPLDLDDRVDKIYLEDGNLHIDTEHSFLSIYQLTDATVLKGDLNNDNIPEVIVNVDNAGGGHGGNLYVNEDYLLTKQDSDNYKIQFLDLQLLNPPKNEYGYRHKIEDIKDGLIIISLAFYSEKGYYSFADGKEQKFKCRLIGTQLKIIE